jgi:glycosyltransferase involved in cell wall biosynthesis
VNREFKYFGCDGLVCTNPEYYETNRKQWPSVLIPNGVNPDRFRPGAGDRAALGLPAIVPLVLMVSALIPSKRVLEGIEAVARAPGMHLVVLGDGELREKAAALGKERLGERFSLRTAPYEQMAAFYRCADVFLHMSQVEPSANAYMEALATGLPIVTHDRPVTQWTLEDQGVLVDTGDFEAVAAGLRRAMALRTPAHVASRRALVERRFSWRAIGDQYAAFLRQVAKREPRWIAQRLETELEPAPAAAAAGPTGRE